MKIHHFADDTNLIFSNNNIKVIENVVNSELGKLVEWLQANKLSLNETKTELIIFRSSLKKSLPSNLTIKINGFKLTSIPYIRYLGTLIDEILSWNYHIDFLSKKLSQSNGIISKLRHHICQKTLSSIYYAIFIPI